MKSFRSISKSTWRFAASIVLLATLAACGGGGSDGAATDSPPASDLPPSGPVLSTGVSSLVGDWLQNGCVAAGGQSFKTVIRATQLSPTSFTYSQGVRTYSSSDCTGGFSLVGPSALGTVLISRSDANASAAANWGTFTTVTSTQSAVVWGKKSETVLCILGDQVPSILPTLADVAASLNIQPALGCSTKI